VVWGEGPGGEKPIRVVIWKEVFSMFFCLERIDVEMVNKDIYNSQPLSDEKDC